MRGQSKVQLYQSFSASVCFLLSKFRVMGLTNCGSKRVWIAIGHDPADMIVYELGNSRHWSGDHGTSACHGLHDGHGDPIHVSVGRLPTWKDEEIAARHLSADLR